MRVYNWGRIVKVVRIVDRWRKIGGEMETLIEVRSIKERMEEWLKERVWVQG